MKLVIDIDDEDYRRIQECPDVFNSLTSRAYLAIRNGTPIVDYLLDCLDKRLGITIIEADKEESDADSNQIR